MKSTIFTTSGKLIDPFDIDPDRIIIEDIANALSHIPRFGGHTPIFYSVSSHSINCSLSANSSSTDALFLLLHDASEAYLLDIPRPVKERLPQYIEAEKAVQNAIYTKFIGRLPNKRELELIEAIDNQLLDIEISAFFGKSEKMYNLLCGTRIYTRELFISRFNKLCQLKQ